MPPPDDLGLLYSLAVYATWVRFCHFLPRFPVDYNLPPAWAPAPPLPYMNSAAPPDLRQKMRQHKCHLVQKSSRPRVAGQATIQKLCSLLCRRLSTVCPIFHLFILNFIILGFTKIVNEIIWYNANWSRYDSYPVFFWIKYKL